MLWLIGMMGSGKSSVGELLADVTGLPFIDTDVLIQKRSGKTIEELFVEGERGFRKLERSVVESVANGEPAIVATGGGAVLAGSNREWMQKGTVVWLKAPVDELAQRVAGGEGRPLLAEGSEVLSALLQERVDIYAALADMEVETKGITQAQVAQTILDVWKR